MCYNDHREIIMIKQLTTNDVEKFCNLIVNMYSNLENLEWFSPMPYDFENVKSILENPRFLLRVILKMIYYVV